MYHLPHYVATSAYKISIYNKKLPRKYQFLSIVYDSCRARMGLELYVFCA
jgi:hypothetical protein